MSMLARVAIFTPIVYLAIWAFIRMVGKRTLSNMNALDLLVTVAVGSTIPAVLLSREVTFWPGLIALSAPLLMQIVIVWLASRSERIERVIKSHPAMLLYDGKPLPHMLKHEMITEEEVREAIRKAGLISIEDAKAVVLEVDGNLSVIPRDGNRTVPSDERSTLHEVKRVPND